MHRTAACIQIAFRKTNDDWKLAGSDNGAGRSKHEAPNQGTGLGTALVSALAKQLDAKISEVSTDAGLTVAVTRRKLVAHLPLAA